MGSRTIVDGLMDAITREYGFTMDLARKTPDDWFWRRVEWTDNTIGWHVGHITYEQDDALWEYFAQPKLYGRDWQLMFGFGSEPMAAETCPPAKEVREAFATTHQRLLDTLGGHDDPAIAAEAPTRDGKTLAFRIGGVLAHLAEHSGGMLTLYNWLEQSEKAGEIRE